MVQEYIVQGTVDTFNRSAFKAKLAALVGVDTSKIALNVSAASVRVTADIQQESGAAAEVAAERLANLTVDELSASLGVDVESVSTLVEVRQIITPVIESEPPLLPPPALPLIVDGEALALSNNKGSSGQGDRRTARIPIVALVVSASTLVMMMLAGALLGLCRRMRSKARLAVRRNHSLARPGEPELCIDSPSAKMSIGSPSASSESSCITHGLDDLLAQDQVEPAREQPHILSESLPAAHDANVEYL